MLDRLDWSIADLTKKVSEELVKTKGGRPVSRASVQFWATGTRQVGPRGKSSPHAVQAPEAIRLAAARVTAREALNRKLGEEAILKPTAWPNVETE